MPLKFVLNKVMLKHGITQYALSKATGVRPNTIQDIREGEPRALTVDKLNSIIAGVSALSGQNYGIEAVMIYEDDPDWTPVETVKRNRAAKD